MVARLPDMPEMDTHDDPPVPEKKRRRRRRLRVRRLPVSVLPTMLTLGNVLCGFVATFFASRSPAEADLPFEWTPLTFAAGFIFIGMVFDALDGRVARLTNSTSELGEQLDSMADMVTFGVAPAFIAVQLVGAGVPYISSDADDLFGRLTLVIGCVYVACAALRLARYTVEARHKRAADPNLFSGLPSPGAAGTIAALALLHQHIFFGGKAIQTDWLGNAAAVGMVAVLLLTALAMVSKLPYTHVMNRYIRDRAKVGTVAGYAIVGLLLMIAPQWSLAFGFTAYALSAPAGWVVRKLRRSGLA
ncbi:MAG: CDP-alcohol phosphatidyltransferase family protein [Phycisphaerales bacterium JB063]